MLQKSPAWIGLLLCLSGLAVTTAVVVGRERARSDQWWRAHAELENSLRAEIREMIDGGIASRWPGEPVEEHAHRLQGLQSLCNDYDIPWPADAESKQLATARPDLVSQ